MMGWLLKPGGTPWWVVLAESAMWSIGLLSLYELARASEHTMGLWHAVFLAVAARLGFKWSDSMALRRRNQLENELEQDDIRPSRG